MQVSNCVTGKTATALGHRLALRDAPLTKAARNALATSATRAPRVASESSGSLEAGLGRPSDLTPTANEGTDGDGDKAEETAEDKDEADEHHTRPVTATASISFANSTARPAGLDHAPCGTGYNGNGAKAVVLLDDDGNVLRSFESQKEAVIALGINATAVRARATRTHDSAGSDYEGW